jgi:hypothetical protein
MTLSPLLTSRSAAMNEARLTPYLRDVLAALRRRGGIAADLRGEPDRAGIGELAVELGVSPDDMRQALLGLRAADCVIELSVEFPGIEPFCVWQPHPQCV